MPALSFTPFSTCSVTRPGTSSKTSGATRAPRAIRPGPRTPTTSISQPDRSVLGVAQTLFASLVQDYLREKGQLGNEPDGRMVALIGDAEMDEGNIFEALLEGWKHGLRNTWWIVDYNRQSLDAIIREDLWARFETLFRNFGWEVVILKHGSLQTAAFREPGGERLRNWIDNCPNQLYAALTFQGGAAWRRRLLNDLGDHAAVSALIDRYSDVELARLMANLGGHDLPSLLTAFEGCRSP